MSSRQINLSLWTASSLLCVTGIVSIAFSLLAPLSEFSIASGTAVSAAAPTRGIPTTQSAASPIPAQIEHAWSLRLRQPLADPENALPVAPTVATDGNSPSVTTVAPNFLPVTLVGTVGDSLALLRTQAGTIEIRSAGESLAGVLIVSVHPRHVEVRFNDKVVSLDKPEPDMQGISRAGATGNVISPDQPSSDPQP